MNVNPRDSFPVVLHCDRPEPRSQQARFFFRVLTVEQSRQVEGLIYDPDQRKLTGQEMLPLLWAALRTLLSGWQNVRDADGLSINYSPEAVEYCLTVDEAWELYYAGIARSRLTDDDRKKFGWPSLSSTAGAEIDGAPAESAAGTSQTQ